MRMLSVLYLFLIFRWASGAPIHREHHRGKSRKLAPASAEEVEPPSQAESSHVHTAWESREDVSPTHSNEVPVQVPTTLAGKGLATLFDELRSTVVRIQAIVAKVNWLQPYQAPSDAEFIGSGFLVADGAHPVFMTNAHVVQDARVVQVQLPGAIGQMIFEAYVPLICKKFDLALVMLKSPDKLREALRSHNGTMHALPIRDSQVSLGLEVAAVGFPLGSSSLKLSEGIISGTEMVDGTMNYQTTAPISPGSSGGPLFALDKGMQWSEALHTHDLKVIGVNFASSVSEGAQNVNYVVPRVHILQVLNEFEKLQASLKSGSMSSKSAGRASSMAKADVESKSGKSRRRPAKAGSHLEVNNSRKGGTVHSLRGSHIAASEARRTRDWQSQDILRPELMSINGGPVHEELPHFQLKIAPIDTIGVESSEALYNTSGGCRRGVFLSRILETSVLRFADPPLPERCFLTDVDNVTLDSFGMGRTGTFLGDPTPFEALLQMRDKVDDPVTLTICREGKETKHVVTMMWREKFNLEVREVEEPHFEKDSLDFEVFGGVTFMQMSMNHVMELLRSGRPQTLSRWLLIENQIKPRLIVTHVEDGTYASRVLTPGMVVSKLNGKKVATLADFRSKFQPEGIAWTIDTDRGLFLSVKFEETLKDQVSSSIASLGKHYLLSPAVLDAAQKLHLLPHGLSKKKSSSKKKKKSDKPL
mmetsp:Transcript_58708/g.108047  ORF Transcript_58708/g.108047 Transcript_58708/m.108047 type:complete len:703 (-) Transcript_58708:49-2157(-)